MTTLPQTTSVRLQRSGSPQIQIPGGPPAAGAPGAFSMTGADAWRVIRQNAWLIALFMILSVAMGVGAFYLLRKYSPKYTSQAMIRVQPAMRYNPLDQSTGPIDVQGIQIEQRTQVSLLKDETLYAQVLQKSDEIKDTGWYKQFNGNVEAAKGDLKKNLSVSPIPETRLIQISFSYANARDAQ
jgi:uncharacterized protein involved in exopolysaccharide biosynthesis